MITREYLRWAMGGGNDKTEYDLFATEGSTAGMVYMFNSLKENFLMKPGDKIALLTPCFTPYLEIPTLKEYGYDIVYVSANKVEKDGYHDWQYPTAALGAIQDSLGSTVPAMGYTVTYAIGNTLLILMGVALVLIS